MLKRNGEISQAEVSPEDILTLEADDFSVRAGSRGGWRRESGALDFESLPLAAPEIRARYRRNWDPENKLGREFALDVLAE